MILLIGSFELHSVGGCWWTTKTRCSPSHRLLLMASLMRWKVWLWPANTRECGWTPSCLHDLFDVTVGSKLTRMSSFVFRSFDKKAAPVSMTKLLSHGYVEEKKTANDDDTSSTLLCSYQPHEGELQWCMYLKGPFHSQGQFKWYNKRLVEG